MAKFRKTWHHLRLVGRLTAWSIGSLVCLFLLAKAAPLALSLAAPELPQSYTLFGTFFSLLSLLALIWIWPSFLRRSLAIDSSWGAILKRSGVVLSVFFVLGLGTTIASNGFHMAWVWVLVSAAACTLLCLAVPRLVLSFLRPGTIARDVLALGFKLRAVIIGRCLIVVGLVSAVAVPNFLRSSMRSPNDEARVMLAAILSAEHAAFKQLGTFVAAGPHPHDPPGSKKTPWRLRENERVAGFDLLGWEPEGDVLCRYGVNVEFSARHGSRGMGFTAEAICDFDGDGEYSAWGYVEPAPGSSQGISGPFGSCPATGAYDHKKGQHRVKWIGPCDKKSGRKVF